MKQKKLKPPLEKVINLKTLEQIIYALTIEDRGLEKKSKWLSRGFKFFNRKPGSLFEYWKKRLAKQCKEDLRLYRKIVRNYRQSRQLARSSEARKKEYPSAREMVLSASDSINKWVNSGFKLASKEDVEKRRQICITCPFWDSMALNATGRCKKCGCSTWAKIKLATESCPEKKW